MAERADITPELCRQLLRYEPETGKLFWKPRLDGTGWDIQYAHREALTSTNSEGYKVGHILNILFRAHRVAWAITHGEWAQQVDHIDGDKANNRLSNLRSATNQENQRNVRLTRNNSSGVTGVKWHSLRKKWVAFIGNNGKIEHLGVFTDKSMAINARKAAEQRLGFSVSHGMKRADGGNSET